MGRARVEGCVNYPLPNGVMVKKDTVLKNEVWRKPGIEGKVLDVTSTKFGNMNVVVEVQSNMIDHGDKLANWHGTKYTVGEKLSDESMPTMVDEVTGEVLKLDLLLSTENVNRGLGGLVREMTATMGMFKSVSEFKQTTLNSEPLVFTFEDEKKVSTALRTGFVVGNGNTLTINEENGSTRTVKASYGIMTVLQLRHVSALKHHYMSMPCNSITVPRAGGTGRAHPGQGRLR